MLTPEQRRDLVEIISQLNKEQRDDLLKAVHSSGIRGMQQFNSDRAKASQVEINGGTNHIGDTYIENIHLDAVQLEDLIRSIIANLGQAPISSNYFPSTAPNLFEYDEYESQNTTVDLFEHNEYESHYTIENSTGNYISLPDIGYFPIIVGVSALIGMGVFFSGILNKTAIVTTSNPEGVNVKDDSAKIKETLPNGTIVSLTGERDSINYCKTNRGWIYCNFLVENSSGKADISQQLSSGMSIVSQKIAIVQPDSQHNGANLRVQPNAGRIIGTVAKGSQVQVIQCRADACEITNNSIKGWIYKPYLRQY